MASSVKVASTVYETGISRLAMFILSFANFKYHALCRDPSGDAPRVMPRAKAHQITTVLSHLMFLVLASVPLPITRDSLTE